MLEDGCKVEWHRKRKNNKIYRTFSYTFVCYVGLSVMPAETSSPDSVVVSKDKKPYTSRKVSLLYFNGLTSILRGISCILYWYNNFPSICAY